MISDNLAMVMVRKQIVPNNFLCLTFGQIFLIQSVRDGTVAVTEIVGMVCRGR